MSPVALRHKIVIPGLVLPWQLPPREVHQMTTKFWGVRGESRIRGKPAGRTLDIPVVVFDEDGRFNTRAKLSTWLDRDVNRDLIEDEATLTVESEAGHPPFEHCTFEGAFILDGPKIDHAGTMGGDAFAICRFIFRQHL